jgi:hypothetical protein
MENTKLCRLSCIFEALKVNTTLKTLILNNNGLTSKDAECIADYFEFLNKNNKIGINCLLLNENKLGDLGALKIVEQIKNYSSMEILGLANNELTDECAKCIYENLKFHPGIIKLDLGEKHQGINISKANDFCIKIDKDLFPTFSEQEEEEEEEEQISRMDTPAIPAIEDNEIVQLENLTRAFRSKNNEEINTHKNQIIDMVKFLGNPYIIKLIQEINEVKEIHKSIGFKMINDKSVRKEIIDAWEQVEEFVNSIQ